MSTEDNKTNDRRIYDEAWNQGNMAVVDEGVATTYVGHDPLSPIHGPEGFKQYLMMIRSAFPDIQMRVEDQMAEGDQLVTRWSGHGTHQGPLMGIPPTGKQGTVTGIVISRYANGQIVETWANWDTLGLLQQLGVIPAPSQESK